MKKISTFVFLFFLIFLHLQCNRKNNSENITQLPPLDAPTTLYNPLAQSLDALYNRFLFHTYKDIAQYISLFKNAKETIEQKYSVVPLDSFEGYHIDIALVLHPGGPKETPAPVLHSQKMLAQFLKKNSYDIIGYEGSTKDGLVTRTDCINEYIDRVSLYGKQITFENASTAVEKGSKHDALYALIKSGAGNIIGVDQKETKSLQEMITYYAQSGNAQYQELIQRSIKDFNTVRSTHALYQTLHYMKSHNLKRGLIVIGRNHERDYFDSTNNTGLVATLHTQTTFHRLY